VKVQSRHIRSLTKAALLAGSALVATPALAQTSGTQLEEVVVTAQKRAQNLQDVPISVSAITQEGLKANRMGEAVGVQADTEFHCGTI